MTFFLFIGKEKKKEKMRIRPRYKERKKQAKRSLSKEEKEYVRKLKNEVTYLCVKIVVVTNYFLRTTLYFEETQSSNLIKLVG